MVSWRKQQFNLRLACCSHQHHTRIFFLPLPWITTVLYRTTVTLKHVQWKCKDSNGSNLLFSAHRGCFASQEKYAEIEGNNVKCRNEGCWNMSVLIPLVNSLNPCLVRKKTNLAPTTAAQLKNSPHSVKRLLSFIQRFQGLEGNLLLCYRRHYTTRWKLFHIGTNFLPLHGR